MSQCVAIPCLGLHYNTEFQFSGFWLFFRNGVMWVNISVWAVLRNVSVSGPCAWFGCGHLREQCFWCPEEPPPVPGSVQAWAEPPHCSKIEEAWAPVSEAEEQLWLLPGCSRRQQWWRSVDKLLLAGHHFILCLTESQYTLLPWESPFQRPFLNVFYVLVLPEGQIWSEL